MRLAGRIVDLLPAHGHYVEPFAGGLSVLLAKPRSKMETINDLDRDLMTFWKVLRDRPEELARACALTPHSRAEHQAAYDLSAGVDELERARRVWVLLSQGRGGTIRRTGWRYYKSRGGSTYAFPEYLGAYTARILDCATRLAGVTLECRPALEVAAEFGSDPEALIYADPPYLASTRSSTNYRHEMGGESEHRDLAAVLRGCRSAVVLSGYRSPLYSELYEGWHVAEMAAWTGNGIRGDLTKTDGDRVEVLWSNRPLGGDHLFSDTSPTGPERERTT